MLFLFSNAEDPLDHGTEDDIGCKLNKEIASNKSEEHIRNNVGEAGGYAPGLNRLKKEQNTAQKKDTGIDNGTNNSRTNNRNKFIFLC